MTTFSKALLGAVSAAGLIAGGGAAQAATIFSATLESDQSQNPDLPADANRVFGQAGLALALTGSGEEGYNLSMTIEFQDVFGLLDWSAVAASGQIDVVGTAAARDDDAFDITRLHIHQADRGETGGVVFGLFDLVPGVPANVANSDMDGETTLMLSEDGSATLVSEWDFDEGVTPLSDFLGELAQASAGEDIGLYFNLHSEEAAAGLIRGQIVAENSLNPVPVPAALPLFASGAAGLAFMRRRRKQR